VKRITQMSRFEFHVIGSTATEKARRPHGLNALLQCNKQTTGSTTKMIRVTTCLENLENLEMSGNLKHVREMSGMLLTVMELSGKKSCHGKVSQNCSLHKTQETINIKLNTLTCTHCIQIH